MPHLIFYEIVVEFYLQERNDMC